MEYYHCIWFILEYFEDPDAPHLHTHTHTPTPIHTCAGMHAYTHTHIFHKWQEYQVYYKMWEAWFIHFEIFQCSTIYNSVHWSLLNTLHECHAHVVYNFLNSHLYTFAKYVHKTTWILHELRETESSSHMQSFPTHGVLAFPALTH